MERERKAQFFAIGLILLSIVIFVSVGLRGRAFITSDPTPHTRGFFERGIEEFPRTVTTGLNNDYSIESLENTVDNYVSFLERRNMARGVTADYFYLTGIKDLEGGTNDYEVSFGNFLGRDVYNVELNKTFNDGTFQANELTNELGSGGQVNQKLDLENVDKVGVEFIDENGVYYSQETSFSSRPFHIFYGRTEAFGESWVKTSR